MKKYLLPLLFIIMASCGPSKEEEARLKRVDDSLMEIERNKAIINANDLLAADTATTKKDSSTASAK
ncbi:MAG: hypothetical protein WCH34_11495 [Bacteroidota bacterium]